MLQNIWATFVGKFCLQDLLKSAQSGHTVDNLIAR